MCGKTETQGTDTLTEEPTQVQLDYDKFAEMSGLTVGSARVTWGKIRRKLASGIEGTPGSAASSAAKPKAKKGAAKKRKTEEAAIKDEDGDNVGSPQSPTAMASERKKKRAKKATKAEVPAPSNEEDGAPEEDETGDQVKEEDDATVKTEEGTS